MRSTLNISLPQPMKEWVETQIAERGFATASEFVRQLLRDEQQRQVRQIVDEKLLAGLDSGKPIAMTPQRWKRLEAEARKNAAKRRRR